MSSGSPSPFARAQLWSADQWASVSLTGARPGASPSPMNSSLDVTSSSLPVQRPPLVYPISLANKQNPPPATSILDSPLARNASLAPRLISDPFPRHSRYYLLDQMAVIMVS
ncbi:hypothetical protein FIBSPDRAFT_865020 [Athelia psychrophila]|uniref:Uncharacterized protein n=1 Tax=Athelia psychrophila TaxID=1759441 RepID=A0A166G0Q6_9AGAM|nr:hypothetical protein FIBSPDRAFT_865020 [Fibularhizoctonia sp. CBS 109695]